MPIIKRIFNTTLLKKLESDLKQNTLTLTPHQEKCYAYLLGLYLGDGCIRLKHRNIYVLKISLHRAEIDFKTSATICLNEIFPDNKILYEYPNRTNVTIVYIYSIFIPLLFPQHGPGRKNSRQIVLHQWQEKILKTNNNFFITGLFDSDGCGTCQSTKKIIGGVVKYYKYLKYSFSNTSTDILNLFTKYVELPTIITENKQNKITRKSNFVARIANGIEGNSKFQIIINEVYKYFNITLDNRVLQSIEFEPVDIEDMSMHNL